ncbi:IS1182 family transposase [Teredinibacter turnerae]|uniref:IS1182 family transposase n=1 Tax=Teredinibacter turnerae TaxID=2426 RepID=UPI000382F0C6|nr:IS1182 family transposase [Teredinibacter turnerae]
MAHYKQGNDKQGEFVAVIPEEQITEGSFDATVCLIVDHVLDLSSFESDFNNDAGGASAYSPGTLLKIILSAYHRGITSSRKIEHLCRYNTVFMALSGFLTPDHSTIAAFVSKNPQRLEGIFIEIVLQCDYLGLIDGDTLALDGCKIPSNASKEWSGTKTDFTKKHQKIQRAVRRVMARHRQEDAQGVVNTPVREKEEKQIAKLKRINKKLKSALNDMVDKRGHNGKVRKTNLTDPDSANMMSGNGGALQGYVGLAATDKLNQVIVNADVTGDSEQSTHKPMIDKLLASDRLDGCQLLADAGFHSGANLDYCAEEGVNAYIADTLYRKRDARFVDHQDKKPKVRKQKYFQSSDFDYDSQAQRCWCPEGKELWLCSSGYQNKGVEYIRFEGYLNDCKNCSMQAQCLRNGVKDRGRQVSIRKDTPKNNSRAIDRMKRKMDSPEGRAIYSDRIGIVEPVFAHMKHIMGLRWFSLRSLKKVSGQWYLFCAVHNLVKIQKYGSYAR